MPVTLRMCAPRRGGLAATLAAAALSVGVTPAHAADPPPPAAAAEQTAEATEAAPSTPTPEDVGKQACLSSFELAQQHRRAGALIEAKRELVFCSQQRCPDVVTVKCTEWLQQVERGIPTIVPAVRDAAGKDIVEAELFIDDRPIATRIDGSALPVNPGPRRLRVQYGERTQELTLVVREGEKRRAVDITFAAPKSVPQTPVPAVIEEDGGLGLSPVGIAGFGVGAVALILGSATGIAAIVVADDLQNRCEGGTCHPAEEPDLTTGTALAHISTGSFILAGVGVAVGTLGLLLNDDDDAVEESGDEDGAKGTSPSARLQLQPMIGLGHVGLSGRF